MQVVTLVSPNFECWLEFFVEISVTPIALASTISEGFVLEVDGYCTSGLA